MINGNNSPQISIMRPQKHLKCFVNEPYQGCTSGPYQGDQSFSCTQAALVSHSHVQGITAQK